MKIKSENLTVTPVLLCQLELEDYSLDGEWSVYDELNKLEMGNWYDDDAEELYFGAESMTLLSYDTLEFTVLNEEVLMTVLEKLEAYLGGTNV